MFSRSQHHTFTDRYNVLQKKLDDLERVHLNGKKALQHQTETDRLKSELSRSQKTITEQTDRIEKQRKHNDALESRIHSLKIAAQADQSEITSLKAKLKSAENDKAQLAKQHHSLDQLESNHRDQLSERDRRIAQLETSLEREIKLRESLQVEIHDLKSTCDADILAARNGTKQAETQLANLQQEREELIIRLQICKSLLSQATEQYSSLFSSTVPSSTHNELKRLHTTAKIKVLRLERQLGNAQDQVKELAHLVRQSNDRIDLFKAQLDDADSQISIYENMLNNDSTLTRSPSYHFDWEPTRTMDDQDLTAIEAPLHQLLATYYSLRSQQLVFAFNCLDKELNQTASLVKQHSQDLASALDSRQTIAANLDLVQQERLSLADQLHTLGDAHATLQLTCKSLQDQIITLKDQEQQAILDHEAAVEKDRNAVQRLTSAIQKSKMAEDALRTEIDRLLTELADAERYQEAYTALSNEVNSLLAKNQLAEEEAERLSKFNAEILGHNNPAQRIAYLDRIRHDLAEAKHKIILLLREQETIVGLNADLQHELDMYKSVAEKQRTHVTRVHRVPLSNVTRSQNTSNTLVTQQAAGRHFKFLNNNLDLVPGEMTLDEIT